MTSSLQAKQRFAIAEMKLPVCNRCHCYGLPLTPKPAATKGKKSKAAPMAADKPVKEEFPSAKALGKRKASKASTTSTTSDGESSYEEVVELEPKKHKKAPGKKMV